MSWLRAGPGVGVAVMFTVVGVCGATLSLSRLGKAMCRELDGDGGTVSGFIDS